MLYLVWRSCACPSMLMDTSRPVQSKPSLLLDPRLPFCGNPTMEGRQQVFGAHSDLALTWSQAGHALWFQSLGISLLAHNPARCPNTAPQKPQVHRTPQLASSFKHLSAGGEFLLNEII